MKKQSLLSAAALTTVVVAGAAQAGTLTAGATPGATVTKAVVVASEVKLDAKTNASGVIGAFLVPSKGAILPTGNSLLTVSLTGGATFGTAVGAGAITKNGTCDPTTTVSKGGGAAESSVTFLISNLGGCTSADGVASVNAIALSVPATVTGSNVNLTTNLTTELGTAIDGGTASTFNATTKTDLISFAKAFSVTTKADAVTTAATLASKFKGLTADTTLGTVVVAADTAALTGIQAGAAAVKADDVTKATFTVKGDLTSVNVAVSGGAFTKAYTFDSTTTKQTTDGPAPATGTYTFNAALAAKTPVITGGAYTVATDLALAAAYTAQPTFGPSSLQNITREGSAYLLPWVASGALATKSTSNSVVRISNIGTEPTGAVSLELLTSSAGVAPSTTLVPVASSIASKGELVLTSDLIQSYIGSDFGRGDVRITVEGQAGDLVVRRFVQSTTTGALSEVSLGRSATGGGSEPLN